MPLQGRALVAAHDVLAYAPRFRVVHADALHIYGHDEFYVGNVHERFQKIHHLLVRLWLPRAHALDHHGRFRREPGHIGNGFFRFFIAVLAHKI